MKRDFNKLMNEINKNKKINIYGVTNPYFENNMWYWYDETYSPSKPYFTRDEALIELTNYVNYYL